MNLNSRMTLLRLVLDGAAAAFCQVPRPMLIFRLQYDLELITADLVWERHTQRRLTGVSDSSDTGLTASTSA